MTKIASKPTPGNPQCGELVILNQGAPVTTSLAMAQGTNNEHASVLALVRKHQPDFEEFGHVDFKSEVVARPQGGGSLAEFVTLNEGQATLLITYMRNTPIVRGFKKRLIKAFRVLVDQVRAQQIQPAVMRSTNYRPRLTAPLVRVMREYLGFENTTAWLVETYPEMFGRLTGPFPRGPQQAFQPALPLVPALGFNFETAAGLNSLPAPTVQVPPKTTRAALNEVVRTYAGRGGGSFGDAWEHLYRECLSRLGVNIQSRAKNQSKAPLDVVEEMGLIEQVYSLACELFGRAA